jgi:hypothetical protein
VGPWRQVTTTARRLGLLSPTRSAAGGPSRPGPSCRDGQAADHRSQRHRGPPTSVENPVSHRTKPAPRPAPRPWRLSVHLPCVHLRGWAGRDQGCPCEPSEPWPGCDVSRAQELCLVCARGTAGGTTRWSWLACTSCRAVERSLQAWLGMRVLPLGRHSIMNGVALAVAEASPEDAQAFGVRFEVSVSVGTGSTTGGTRRRGGWPRRWAPAPLCLSTSGRGSSARR